MNFNTKTNDLLFTIIIIYCIGVYLNYTHLFMTIYIGYYSLQIVWHKIKILRAHSH